MLHDATGASLPDLFRSLNVDPAEKEALVRLAEKVSRLEHEREHQQMLFGEQPVPPPPPKPKRDRHGLHIVRGLAPAAAALALVRHHRAVRGVLAGAALMATATGATLAPDMLQPAPASQVPRPHPHAIVHHHHRAPVPLPPVLPAKRRRGQPGSGATVRPSPSPSPSPSPDPVPTVIPVPLPSVPPPPAPSPDPTCTPEHPGKHCHSDGSVVAVRRTLRGLTGQP